MCPNFRKLKKIKNEFLRTAIYTATGKERRRLEKAFPEYYVEVLDKIRIPASILRNNTDQQKLNWGELLERWGIPLREWGVHHASQLPDEIWSQLAGQKLRSGIEVEYKGRKFILVFYCDNGGPDLRLGNRFPKKRKPDWDDSYSFVLANFIDFES